MSVFVKITGSILLASGDFFRVFENVVPELRGHVEGGGDAALAGGFVGFGQNVVEQHGHTLILTALDVHRLRTVAQPGKRDVEHAADVRDGAVTRFAVTGFNYGNKVSGKSSLSITSSSSLGSRLFFIDFTSLVLLSRKHSLLFP